MAVYGPTVDEEARIRPLLNDTLRRIEIKRSYYHTFRNHLLADDGLGPAIKSELDLHMPEKGMLICTSRLVLRLLPFSVFICMHVCMYVCASAL